MRLVGVGIAVLLAAAAVPAKAGAVIQLQPVLSNLTSPIFVTNARDGSNRLFVVEQAGVIKVLQPMSATLARARPRDESGREHVDPGKRVLTTSPRLRQSRPHLLTIRPP